jgi:hypothetical protein
LKIPPELWREVGFGEIVPVGACIVFGSLGIVSLESMYDQVNMRWVGEFSE